MPSLADRTDRARLADRVCALTAEATPRWGRMNAAQMLAHCADALRNATGELPIALVPMPFARNGLVRWLMIDLVPFPKGAPTARELRARAPASIAEERDALLALLDRFAPEHGPVPWAPHPLFGTLTPAQWGRLAHKHLDHHLRQFGV